MVWDIFNHRRTFRNSKDPTWVKRPPRGKRKRTASPALSSDGNKHSTHSNCSSRTPSNPHSELESEKGQAATPCDHTPPPSLPSSPPPIPAGHQGKGLPPDMEELEAKNDAEPMAPNSAVCRSAHHAAAIAAADAAANDDQRASTQEKVKKAGTAKKAGAGKPRGWPPKGGRGKGKGTSAKTTWDPNPLKVVLENWVLTRGVLTFPLNFS
ncbi:hypothetical protein RhiJN_24487 [Ceratobasidium sp. AG-Ba]|nr:hypothetical protein RhiJN_24487 [Ceratobasidium sp. AG-Ba]